MCVCMCVQLPKHIDEQVVLGAISLEKDVDGFHPLNVGHLTMKVSVVHAVRADADVQMGDLIGSINTNSAYRMNSRV